MSSTTGGGVEIREMSVRYPGSRKSGEVTAISDTTVSIEPGSFVTLLGASGCGKSTLLNAIAGFIGPSSGSISIDGHPVTAPGPDRAVVFQQYALLPWLSAQGNVELALKRFGYARAERKALALQSLDAVQLGDSAAALPAELSGGMQQRVSIARALAAQPRVLLMDEPFGALDAITRAVMQELVLDIFQRTGVTVIFVTHDVDEALFLSQRILLMSARPGRIADDIALVGTDDAAKSAIRTRIVHHLGGH